MNFQFVLPNSSEDLLNSEGDIYYVKHVFSTNESTEKLHECKNVALAGDPFYIFDHFDTYFSVIENAQNLSMKYLLRSYDLLYFTVDSLGKKLSQFTKSKESTETNDKNAFLNLTKMTMYLIVETVKAIDLIMQQNIQENLVSNKRGKKNNLDSSDTKIWEQKKNSFLVQLYNFMQLQLEKLWSPPVAEENFINLLCDVAYRTLETSFAKDRQVGDTIFQILGTAIKRYNHALTFPVKILQIMRTNETALTPTANGINLLYEEFGLTTVFSVLIKEIVDSLNVDAADSKISRNFGIFLTELGTIAPKLLIPHLSTLADELLNLDSYVLRNCILQIMSDVIISHLTSEDLSDELKETRDEFLEDLLAHINDVSAYVRSKVLQLWNHIKEENSVPLAFQHKVLKCGVERLEDKTPSVRKNAIILIKSFLERNPFSAKLSLEELKKRWDDEKEKLEKLREIMAEENKVAVELEKKWEEVVPELLPIIQKELNQNTQEIHANEDTYEDLVPKISSFLSEKKYVEAVALSVRADFAAGNAEIRKTLNFEDQCIYFVTLLKSYLFISNGCKDRNEEYITQENTVKFLEDSIEFSDTITQAVPKIQEMLLSKTNSDVFEAIDFFTTGYLFGIKGTEGGMRQMLFLIWCDDTEKKDAVLNAYKRVLFTTDQEGRAHEIKVVKNLCTFLNDINYGHYTALEVLIRDYVEKDVIDASIIQVMFERFTLKLEDTTENESRQALQLLIMCSAAQSSIATANISIIEKIGFETRGLEDPRIFCGCIAFLLNSISSSLRSKFYTRYNEDNQILGKILNGFTKFFFSSEVTDFDSVASRTFDFIYQMCQSPDLHCKNIIAKIHNKIKKISETVSNLQAQTNQSQEETRRQFKVPVFLVSRFIFIIGYVTMKEMIFLDIDVYNNMKLKEDLKEERSNVKKKAHKRKTHNLEMSASESLKRLSGTAAEPQQEPDKDLVGATAEDSIAELINYINEEVLLYSPDGLLPKMIPIVIEICKFPTKYNDEELQQAATLALIRFMAVSSKFCEDNIPFLMNILHKTTNIKIKCNIVIGLSDLTFRFPNVLEPWTGHFYSTLHEKNEELRLTAVKMLSHLILHEMIRVKGQIATLAMCIVDRNEEVRNITQQFFKEIASNSNILYNVLPDIISKLSDVQLDLEEEKYRTIMKYILGLIQKDRQVESLVEKLCLRFRVTNEERQWRDIAFCLSLLNYTEKTIKKLIDNIQYFKDKVQLEDVYHSFKLIISNTSKAAKPELKTVVSEFETRLAECLEVKDADGNDSEKADMAPKPTVKTKSQQAGARKRSERKKKSDYSSSSGSEEERLEAPRSLPVKTKPQRPIRSIKTRIIEFSSSDNSEETQEPKKVRGKK